MKQIIIPMILLLMVSFVVAGPPPIPWPASFTYLFDEQPIVGFTVTFDVDGQEVTRVTNSIGKIGLDIGTASADFPIVDFQSVLTTTCGFEICDKSWVIFEQDLPFEVEFRLNELPPLQCPSCNCGGGGSSSGSSGGGVYCTEDYCIENYPVSCPDPICDSPTIEECEDIVETTCDTCEVCDDVTLVCDDPEQAFNYLALLLGLAGGATIMFTVGNNKIFTGKGTGMKRYRGQDDTLKLHHKHPGTRGYHNPDTVHRKPEDHPKGMMDVSGHYHKDDKGEWYYEA